jgi:putative chitinase
MITITPRHLSRIGQRNANDITRAIAEAINKYSERYEVTTVARMAMFLANGAAETGGYTSLTENMNYSARRLRQVWPSRFKTDAIAQQYANDPQKLANYVYGGRMGNAGRENAGWLYRGRGFFQSTGYERYAEFERITGVGVIDNPDILGEPDAGVEAAFIFWERKGLAPHADRQDVRRVRYLINGGYTGLDHVQAAHARALQVLNARDNGVREGVGRAR